MNWIRKRRKGFLPLRSLEVDALLLVPGRGRALPGDDRSRRGRKGEAFSVLSRRERGRLSALRKKGLAFARKEGESLSTPLIRKTTSSPSRGEVRPRERKETRI